MKKEDYRILKDVLYKRAIPIRTIFYVQKKKKNVFGKFFWKTLKEQSNDDSFIKSIIYFETENEAEEFIDKIKQNIPIEGWITEIVSIKRIKLIEKLSKKINYLK